MTRFRSRRMEQAIAADGNQIDVRLELGLVASDMGDLAAAEKQNRAVLGIDLGQPDALHNLGAISANRGDVPHPRELWSTAISSAQTPDAAEQLRRAIERLEVVR